jgi:hypothetical protein
VQRAPGGEAGSFDDKALAACLDAARIAERKPIALVSLAGPLVPTTFRDALIASLKRAGVADAIATP